MNMSTWLLPRLELTPEQLRVVEMPTGEHRVIVGPPGSGKTQILVHRADHIAQTYRVPSDKCLPDTNAAGMMVIVKFWRVLKDYLGPEYHEKLDHLISKRLHELGEEESIKA